MSVILKNVCYSFDGKAEFFKPIFLKMPSQGLIFITGSNGIGKSTLFKAMQGICYGNERVSGEIMVNNCFYSYQNETDRYAIRRSIQQVAQDYRSMLAPDFTVKQQLQAAQLSMHPGLQSMPRQIGYLELLEKFGIRLDQKAASLSGGQAQIVAIVMMLQRQPRVVLLDEPTAALDTRNTRLLMNFLEELIEKDELLILMICHDRNLMDKTAALSMVIESDKNNLRTISIF